MRVDTSRDPLRFNNPKADLFVPDGTKLSAAFSRTTHLCIAAHQDDIEIMAQHGISECFMRQDRWFSGVVVTDGAGSPRAGLYAGYDDNRMRRVRMLEQRKAAYIGGYSVQIQLGYPSAAVKVPPAAALVEDLVAVLKATRPEVLYLHNPADKHDTHVAIMLRSLEAVRLLPPRQRPRQVLGCEVWRSLDWLDDADKKILPVSERPNLCSALLGIYDSQISGGKRYDLAAIGRRVANATYQAAHETDRDSAVIYAVDLTRLCGPEVPDLDSEVEGLVSRLVAHLQADVIRRLRRVAGKERLCG
jgi:LmbE family N-acetylglucosaminyl deacetylase